MSKHSELANTIGRSKIAAALGVGETAISNAVVRKSFPASWFIVLQSLAESEGIECPADLFKMRLPDNSPRYVDNASACQENVSRRETGKREITVKAARPKATGAA